MKVLVVDDAAVVRKLLRLQLSRLPQVDAVLQAADAYEARSQVVTRKPDLLILDLGLPKVSGLHLMEKLAKHHPVPVIVFSAHAARPEVRSRALELGALAVLEKPTEDLESSMRRLTAAVEMAASKLQGGRRSRKGNGVSAKARLWSRRPGPKVIVVGSSTGGPEALERVLTKLPIGLPPILIAQHMPPRYLPPLVSRLDRMCAVKVKIAADSELLRDGTVYVAPVGRHLELRKKGRVYGARLTDGPPEHFQRPAADVLFRSTARWAGGNAIGVLLTGMGRDGATGMLQMHRAGAFTIAQDEATCAVYGMPREAVELGAVDEIAPLPRIPSRLVTLGRPAVRLASAKAG